MHAARARPNRVPSPSLGKGAAASTRAGFRREAQVVDDAAFCASEVSRLAKFPVVSDSDIGSELTPPRGDFESYADSAAKSKARTGVSTEVVGARSLILQD